MNFAAFPIRGNLCFDVGYDVGGDRRGTAIPDLASSEASNDTGVSIIKDMGGNMKDATDSAIGDYLDIPPTLSTDQGAVVMVRVDSDLEFY